MLRSLSGLESRTFYDAPTGRISRRSAAPPGNRPWLHQHQVKSMQLCTLAQWEPIEFTLARQSLFWLGHVARMGCHRLPQKVLFGWWTSHMTQPRPRYRKQQSIQYLIQVTELDWFRLAQDRDGWRQCHCPQGFAKSNSLVAHYVDHHACADPDKPTVEVCGCEACGQYWRVDLRAHPDQTSYIGDANRRCQFCGSVLGSVQARKNRESRCQ